MLDRIQFFFFFSIKILIYQQVFFRCSGSNSPPPSTGESHVDPHSGVHFQEVTATISRDLIFEYFGKPPFKCECHAWSPRGKVKSQAAAITLSCKYILSVIFIKLLLTNKITTISIMRVAKNCFPPRKSFNKFFLKVFINMSKVIEPCQSPFQKNKLNVLFTIIV